jgi:hypothetical protein
MRSRPSFIHHSAFCLHHFFFLSILLFSLLPYTLARWKLGLLAAVAVMLLALYPQLNLLYVRGADWQGSYAHIDSDEVAYSAYLAALIEGRPRLSDPYTGRDDAPGATQHESLFSIQFIPPFALAAAARALGINATTVFILLLPICALCASLAVFWLMLLMTEDERVAATAVLVVLCLGTLGPVYVAWQIFRGADTTFAFSFLPFLRRFQPSVSFPFFFLFCAFVWRTLRSLETKTTFLYGLTACMIFALLVFSYFYLWTAALGWLLCLALSLFAFGSAGRRRDIRLIGIILAAGSLAFIPYYMLLRNRAPSMDTTQLLAFSRRPDLFHWSEIIGLAVIAALAWARRRAVIERNEKVAAFAASFALLPLVVFNQQILTGRSLQPLHYDLFIAKYVALIALILTAALIHRGLTSGTRRIPTLALCLIAVASFGWGWVEAVVATRRYVPVNISLDRSRRAALRLAELARADGLHRPVTLSTDLILADSLPTDAPLAVLWAPHLQVFSGADALEHKQRIYRHLYYTGVHFAHGDEHSFERLDPHKRYFINSLLGWGRSDAAWNVSWQPISPADIETELRAYREFSAAFNRDLASHPALSYVVIPAWQQPDMSNLDRWYERDAGEQAGDYIIYRVRLRP